MGKKIKNEDGLSSSEIAAELVEKAAKLKERTALLKEKMAATQKEANKILHPKGDNQTPQ